MTKKIFRSVFTAAMVIFLACLVMIIGVLYDYFSDLQRNQLKTELSLATRGVEAGGANYLTDYRDKGCRLTLIGDDGEVLFDSEGDPEKMENHLDREEVREALESGEGESSRYSDTMTERTVYRAVLLSDGNVLRASVSQATVPLLLFGMLQPLIVIFTLALLLSYLFSRRLSHSIVRPLESLNLDKPLENNTYDELSPVLNHIEKQHRQIERQLRELDKTRSEFDAVTRNMREGLVLLGGDNEVLSINPAAASFFMGIAPGSSEFYDSNRGAVGRDFSELCGDKRIAGLLDEAKEHGGGELQISRDGREYRLSASGIEGEVREEGVAILIFDVTDRYNAERQRREFTANVSHELKTPLQSIMGSAELIENGMVKKEDLPGFTRRIYSEASRLVTLIDDIIRLSSLDENAEQPKEEVELYSLARSVMDSLEQAAGAHGVKISVEGRECVVIGVRQLCGEIIYNLLDNAVKYNREGGWVKAKVGMSGAEAYISVEDSGIGIAPEEQSRVFERFYRVDKSRSKEKGGTGLGLSIVKHAAAYMSGRVELESEPGVGTKITVFLPRGE